MSIFLKWARNYTSSYQTTILKIQEETISSQKTLQFQQVFFQIYPSPPIIIFKATHIKIYIKY